MSSSNPSPPTPRHLPAPTLEGLAHLLDAITGDQGSEDARATVIWLFEQLPELRELWQTINEPTTLGVRRLDLLWLLFTASTAALWPEGEKIARELIARVESAEEQLATLDRMAEEIGGRPPYEGWVESVLAVHRDFEELLERRGWENPAQILDPNGEVGVDTQRLIKIGAARLERADDPAERRRLGAVLQKLLDGPQRQANRA